MLWIAIYCPQLALDIALRGLIPAERPEPVRVPSGRPMPGGACVAVCNHVSILQSSERARALGVHPGCKRATALALAPDLLLIDHDLNRDAAALEQIATWALQFTPSISLQPPDSLLLEVDASLNLFGGFNAVLTRLRSGLMQLGFDARLGSAPTATGAWLLAQQELHATTEAQLRQRLANLPIPVLTEARPHLRIIDGIGMRIVRELIALPRAGLVRRFGQPLLDELDRALGRRAEPRAWFVAGASFQARLELLAQVELAEALLFGARRLILQLTGWLAARHAATACFELSAEHDDRAPTVLTVRLASASRDADRLITLLREQLTRVRLPAPVHSLELRCADLRDQTEPTAALFPGPLNTQQSLARLLERLQARLGREHVQRLRLAEDHRPEAAFRLEVVEQLPAEPGKSANQRTRRPNPLKQATTGTSADASVRQPGNTPRLGLPRPLWLLAEPINLIEHGAHPYYNGSLNLLAGPERIEGGWWDSAFVERDYFIAEGHDATLYWIYRVRFDQTEPAGWYLQGRFG